MVEYIYIYLYVYIAVNFETTLKVVTRSFTLDAIIGQFSLMLLIVGCEDSTRLFEAFSFSWKDSWKGSYNAFSFSCLVPMFCCQLFLFLAFLLHSLSSSPS